MISSGCSLELASLRTRRNGLQPGGACSGRVELFSSHLSPFWPRSGPFSNLCGTHLPPLNPVEREREREGERATCYSLPGRDDCDWRKRRREISIVDPSVSDPGPGAIRIRLHVAGVGGKHHRDFIGS
ncbi:hypothetical protein POX_a00618 [Penicillium oxalicum]|uniref:hypothetical protein n=1 Tax=Penicillium oxalicum TaxID=69781 RepID=UPI0020B7F746|nr:hypothetical protein POX_a00618 [Penicillium oxalicum]KAI2794028.1 hypothetical protein POX_a00618 [Penicillium oxalicum]